MSEAGANAENAANGDDAKHNGGGHGNLTMWIVIAIVLAIILALVFPHFAASLEIGGEIFLRLLKMIVVPLVITSVLSGILGLGDVRKLGRPGAAAVGYYLSTTILAVVVGLIVVNVIRPGVGFQPSESFRKEQAKKARINALKARVRKSLAQDVSPVTAPTYLVAQGVSAQSLSGISGPISGAAQMAVATRVSKSYVFDPLTEDEVAQVFKGLDTSPPQTPGIGDIFRNLFLMLFTDNLFHAALEVNLLPLIVFSIVFGAMLTTLGSKVKTITEIIDQSNVALMNFVLLLMKVAPLGIFCLVTARFGEAQAEGQFLTELMQIGWYFCTVLVGLAFHAFVTLPLIFWIIRRENPYKFMYRMSKALLTAFSTASSSATLPVTMECAEKEAGISKRSTEFVIPLGATINMDGTALYEAAACIFISQVVLQDLSFAQQIIVALTATLAAIGAAGIPEAGLVTLLIVLNAVGLPLEYVGLILSVDWLLDRFRTAVNAFGDSVGAAVVEGTMPPESASPGNGPAVAQQPAPA